MGEWQSDGGSSQGTGSSATHSPAPSHTDVAEHGSSSSHSVSASSGAYTPEPSVHVPIAEKHVPGGVVHGVLHPPLLELLDPPPVSSIVPPPVPAISTHTFARPSPAFCEKRSLLSHVASSYAHHPC